MRQYFNDPSKGPRIKKIPDGDSKERLVCPECDHIEYQNPKIVNVVVATYGDKFLFCKRNISPRKGYWTLPGGYMELGETLREGAAREAVEESGATVKPDALLAIYQPPSKSEVIMIFRGEMTSAEMKAGIESQEVKLFTWDEIPWNELAFPFLKDALMAYKNAKGKTDFAPVIIEPKPGGKPPILKL